MDAWPVAMVAAIRLSGQLGLCHNDQDLEAAALHYFAHLHGVVFNETDWCEECRRVLDELIDDGIDLRNGVYRR
jgi:hypothetical protein